jgi:PII-like signaling protein
MLTRGQAKKVTIYLNEDTKAPHGPLHRAIMEFLTAKSVAGATLIRPYSGFGPHGQLHTPEIEARSEHLPVRIEFIETAEKVERLLPALYEMVTDGLIEAQDTTIIKAASGEAPKEKSLVKRRERKAAKLMRIFLGEADRWDGEPLYEAIVRQLRMMEISGATVERGILGYGAKGHTHKEGFLHLSHDLPIVISVIDSAEKLQQAAAAIEEMMSDGLIAISDVDVVRLTHEPPITN